MTLQQPMNTWLDALASDDPAPGGGAAAALAGALGAALISMVARFTVGRRAYAAVAADAEAVLATSEALRARLNDLVEADAEAFQGVATAYRLPKLSDDDRQTRQAAIQGALAGATEVPLQVAEVAGELLQLARRIAAIGNRTVLTDAGAAAMLARAAQRAALLNVAANVGQLPEGAERRAFQQRMDHVEYDAEALVAATLQLVAAPPPTR